MKALVLAAGIGKRLKPLTLEKPKSMLPIGGKPLLEHIIEALSENGIKEISVVVNYKKDIITNHFKDGSKFGVKIKYLVQENPKGGTADAVKCADGKINESFILLNGDILFNHSILKKLIASYKDCDGVITCKEVENPEHFGVLETKGEFAVRIVEKSKSPPSNLANLGIYIMPESIFDAIRLTKPSERGELEITDSIQVLLDRGSKFKFLKVNDFWMDIGRIEDYEKANDMYNKNKR
jgi:bifunctional UDP-N-acetylglucosamine pyrophosphorylase/glucosamine-1-phosphate N-acetyltransferase